MLALFWALPEAWARVSFDSPYTYDQNFQAALRYVRVDLGLRVTEKDPAAGYLLFDYRSHESGDRVSPGSIELIPTANAAVRVVVQLPQMPRYHEQVLASGLERKLRTEYGTPPPRPIPSAPAPAPSGSSAHSHGSEHGAGILPPTWQ